MFSAHKEIIIAIAGVFLFLPSVILGLFIEVPAPFDPASSEAASEAVLQLYAANWPFYLLTGVFSIIGYLAIQIVALDSNRPTVAEALTISATLLLTYLAASILAGIAAGIGVLFLIVPGIYLMIKFLLVSPVIAAERILNPITVLKRSWEITRKNSLRIFGFFLIVVIVGLVALVAVSAIFGIVFNLILPASAALFANSALSALLGAAFSVVICLAYAAIYKQLTGIQDSVAELFE